MVNSVNRRRASRKKNTYGMGSGVTKQSNTANRRKRKSPSSVVASPSKSRQTNEAKSQANMRALRAKTVTAKSTAKAEKISPTKSMTRTVTNKTTETKPKTTYDQAWEKNFKVHPTGGTREDKYGNIYDNTPEGKAQFKKDADAWNKKNKK